MNGRAAITLGIMVVGFLIPCVTVVASVPPSRMLHLGDTGPDVYALQVFLNTSPDTQVAESGAGSPGQETDYFGPLTLNAVEKFQQKYAAEILTPLGLSFPTGFVGPSTLAQMNSVAGQSTPVAQAAPASAPATASPSSSTSAALSANAIDFSALPAPTPLTPNMVIPPGVNENSINLDYAIAVTDALGKQKGYNPAELVQIETAMRASVATTTVNYAQRFFSSLPSTSAQKNESPLASVLETVFAPILSFFGMNNIAHAITPAIPFGTPAVVIVIPCTCSVDVLDVIMTPLPPSFAASLAYVPGTQLFSHYNVSHPKQAILGFYTVAQTCYEYAGLSCIPVPTQGTITPDVGSSAI